MKKFYLILLWTFLALAANAERRVYFENTGNWAKVYAWAWSGSTNHTGGQWPGVELPKVGDYYICDINAADDVEVQIIFNGGDGQPQTTDLKFVDEGIYTASGYSGNTYEGEPLVVEHTVFLSLESNDWSASDEQWKFTKDNNITFVLEGKNINAGDHFKIVEKNGESEKWYGAENGLVILRQNKQLIEGGTNLEFGLDYTNLTFTYNSTSKRLVVSAPGQHTGNGTIAPVGEYDLYFDNNDNWENVYVYIWSENPKNERSGRWPGTKITDGEHNDPVSGYLKFHLDVGEDTAPLYIIFNNGGGVQTDDLEVHHSGVYNCKGFTDVHLDLGNIDPDDPVDPENLTTVYFADNGSWNDLTTYVWVNGSSTCVAKWPGDDMVATGKNVKIDGNIYPVYSYTFPTKNYNQIIFNRKGKTEQTSDAAVVANALYYLSGNKNSQNRDIPTIETSWEYYDGPIEPEEKATVYFANTQNWPAITAYVWDSAQNNYVGWPGSDMVATGNKYKVGNTSYDVYSYTFPAKFTNIVFNHKTDSKQQSVDATVKDGAIYYPNGEKRSEGEGDDKKDKDVLNVVETWTPEVPADSYTATIYFNAGQDLFSSSKMKYKPSMGPDNVPLFLNVYKKGTDELESMGRMKFVEGRDALLYCEVPNAQLYDGIKITTGLKVPGTDDDLVYDCKGIEPDDDDEGSTFDAATWDKFIYGTGNGCVHQSYMTFEDLEENRNNSKENIYFIGQGIGRGEWDRNDLAKIDDTYPNGEPKGWMGQGVYVREFSSLSPAVEFKMSSVDPADYKIIHNITTDFTKRWWATFNLAIVGYIPGATGSAKMEGSVSGLRENGVVYYNLNEIEQYSNYNQYNWSFDGVESGKKYYLVIDTKYRTTALVDFKPQPTLTSAKLNNFQVIDLEEQPEISAKTANVLRGSANSGAVHLKDYNMMTAAAQVVVSQGIQEALYKDREYVLEDNSRVTARYDVIYGLYSNDEYVGGFHGIPEAEGYSVTLTNLGTGEDSKLAIRCTYIEPEVTGGLCFRSLSEYEEITAENADFNPFEDVDILGKRVYRDKDGWHMAVKLSASHTPAVVTKEGADPVTLTMYPDVRGTNSKGSKVRVMSTEDAAYVNKFFTDAQNQVFKFDGMHEKYSEGAYDHSKHNWSKKANDLNDNGATFELIVENIAPATATVEQVVGKDVDFTILASYPFLVNSDNTPEVHAQTFDGINYNDIAGMNAIKLDAVLPDVPARVIRRAAADDARMTLVAEPTAHTLAVDNNAMSGIADAVIGAEDDAEYFTLQGIRVEGELTPGIYLRRSAGVAEKVVIR